MAGNRRLHLDDYPKAIRQNGEMMVDDVSELIDLDGAFRRTMDIYAPRQEQRQAA